MAFGCKNSPVPRQQAKKNPKTTMNDNEPGRLLFTVDTAQNEATLQFVGEEGETLELQKKRFQLLVDGLNAGAMNPALAQMGLPETGPTNQLVILKEENLDQETVALLCNSSALAADFVLNLAREVIDV
jgi:hypothetical protein